MAGIRGQDEQEQRATSSLLAVMTAVPDFAHGVLRDLNAPRGKLSTFTEVAFTGEDARRLRPDGAIVVERGKTRWTCLVEVKTGGAELRPEQVERYLDLARENEFDAVLTISNAITRSAATSPVPVDKRKLRKVSLWHLSWWQILTEAIMQHRHRQVSDPEQAWILGELIAYLDHEKSGAGGFEDMGDKWVTVREAARNGTLRLSDKELPTICQRWDQFIQFVCLGLSQDLGRDVAPQRPRKQTDDQRLEELKRSLVDNGKLSAAIRVPDAAGALEIEADLRARSVTTSVIIDLPREGRPLTRVNWLLRQLRDARGDLRLTAGFANLRQTSSELHSKAKERPETLLSAADPRREPRWVQIAWTRPMGLKRGRAQGSFVADTRQQAIMFYGEILQSLKPWRPGAPKLPTRATPEPEVAQPDPPPFSAPDARLPGEATQPTDDT